MPSGAHQDAEYLVNLKIIPQLYFVCLISGTDLIGISIHAPHDDLGSRILIKILDSGIRLPESDLNQI